MLKFSKKTVLLAAAAVCVAGTWAAPIGFSYSNLADTQYLWGTGKAEHYDVAVFVDGNSFAGARVTGLQVEFPAGAATSGWSGWLTDELVLENKLNVPGICTAAGKVAGGRLTVDFEEPVTVGPEGLYAGYSFDVDMADDLSQEAQYPLIVTEGINSEGLYMHTSRTYLKWKSVSEKIGVVSSMMVMIEGDFGQANVSVTAPSDLYASLEDGTWELPLTITSVGSEPIASLEITLETYGSTTESYVFDYNPALAPQFGYPFPLTLQLPVSAAPGEHEGHVTVTKINGIKNSATGNAADFTLHVLGKMVTRCPLMEEYTGLWCGYCPRGFAAMEYMSANYPDDFVGVAYHSGVDGAPEAMMVIPTTAWPNEVYGFPSSFLDRTLDIDPYYGTSGGFGLPADWQNQRALFTPADISATLVVGEDNLLHVGAETEFVSISDADYDIEFILLADGLTQPSWIQNNYFAANNPAEYEIEELQQFCKGGKYGKQKVPGIIFNDVAVATSGRMPLVNAADIEREAVLLSEFDFDKTALVSTLDFDLGTIAQEFHVVAVLIDRADGHVVNCAKSPRISNTSGVGANTAIEIASTRWVDLQGRAIDHPEAGLCIRIDTMADGSVHASKVMK